MEKLDEILTNYKTLKEKDVTIDKAVLREQAISAIYGDSCSPVQREVCRAYLSEYENIETKYREYEIKHKLFCMRPLTVLGFFGGAAVGLEFGGAIGAVALGWGGAFVGFFAGYGLVKLTTSKQRNELEKQKEILSITEKYTKLLT